MDRRVVGLEWSGPASSARARPRADRRRRGARRRTRPVVTPEAGGTAVDAGATVDATSSDADGGTTGPQDAGATSHDGGVSPADAGKADAAAPPAEAGIQPYKGVANSACGDLTTLGVSWYHNWELTPECETAPFVPMIWGHASSPTEQTAAGITSEINGVISAGYDTVLGFNEPDNTSQSNISVATAISLWPSFNNPALRLGSPATQANTTGLAWFTSFMDQVNADTTGTLRVDFIAAHWYGWNSGSCDAKAATLEAYLKQLEAIPGNRPIWLTEWGCLNDSNPTAAVVQAFFSGALAMLKGHPRVERYAWYPWETNNELVGDAGLTSLGTVFSAAPAAQ